MRNPFCFEHPVASNEQRCFVEPAQITDICDDLLQRNCCLIVGPPGSGTSTTLRAVQERFQQDFPYFDWWYIDLIKLPKKSPEALFRALAEQGMVQYPGQREIWSNVLDESSFCRALRISSQSIARPLYLGIDHIETIPHAIARIVVRSVRSIHVNWDSNKKTRLITVVLAGSKRLVRQSIGRGSPLNFAKVHHVDDWSWKEANSLLHKNDHIVRFTDEAAEYLFRQTNGDKYLLQRLAYTCTEDQLRNNSSGLPVVVDLVAIQDIITRFVWYEHEEDPQLSRLMPELIKNPDALQHVIALIDGKDAFEFEDTSLDRLDYNAPITRVLRSVDNAVQIRNPIYRSILIRKAEILRAAFQSVKIQERDVERLRKIYRLEQQARIASQSSALPSGLLNEIAALAEADETVLLRYDEVDQTFRFHAASTLENRYVDLEIDDAKRSVRKLLSTNHPITCVEAPSLCIGNCRESRNDYCCEWRLLSVNDDIQTGALVFRRGFWAVSEKKNHEIGGLLATLAEILRTHRRSMGLYRLSTITVSYDLERKIVKDICDSVAYLFNASFVYLWEGHRTDARLNVRAVSPDAAPNWSFLSVSDWLQGTLHEDAPAAQLINIDACSSSQRRAFSQGGFRNLLLIAFDFQDHIGVLGVAFRANWWTASDVDFALSSAVKVQARALLSNLLALTNAQRESESSRLGVQLLNHQLSRSPSLIMREAELLLDGKKGPLLEAQNESLQKIQFWVERHGALLERLLDPARWESGTLPRFMCNEPLSLIARQVVNELEAEVSVAGMKLQFESGVTAQVKIQVDKVLLAVALENMIRNSIQYARRGNVTVRVRNQDDQVRIEVEDQGPGIPTEYQNVVFYAYHRGSRKSSTAEPNNLGLGLFLVRRTMELHGGFAFYDSTYRLGARIVLVFPGGVEYATQTTYG